MLHDLPGGYQTALFLEIIALLLPLTIWVTLWVGLTLASVIFGNLWRDIEPWTGPVRKDT